MTSYLFIHDQPYLGGEVCEPVAIVSIITSDDHAAVCMNCIVGLRPGYRAKGNVGGVLSNARQTGMEKD
jgi:hypothetical protein